MSEPSLSAMANRRVPVVAGVVLLHLAGLWTFQNGLLRRAVDRVMPVQWVAVMVDPPQPLIPPPTAPMPHQPLPASPPPHKASPKGKAVAPPSRPQPIADPDPAPETASSSTLEHLLAVPLEAVAPPPAPAAIAAPPAPPRAELPTSSADYLNNAPPTYPSLSMRRGEQGKVVVRVFIDANGVASRAELRISSGHDLLDQTALRTVLKWRYVPGTRAGSPKGMWFNVPINFVLG